MCFNFSLKFPEFAFSGHEVWGGAYDFLSCESSRERERERERENEEKEDNEGKEGRDYEDQQKGNE